MGISVSCSDGLSTTSYCARIPRLTAARCPDIMFLGIDPRYADGLLYSVENLWHISTCIRPDPKLTYIVHSSRRTFCLIGLT